MPEILTPWPRMRPGAPNRLPTVCPLCESHDIQVVSADSDRVKAVCKACFARFHVVPYDMASARRPSQS
jgi:hypothetical protein